MSFPLRLLHHLGGFGGVQRGRMGLGKTRARGFIICLAMPLELRGGEYMNAGRWTRLRVCLSDEFVGDLAHLPPHNE